MEKKSESPKVLKKMYMPSAEFYSQIIDSLQDYSIFTIDKDYVINSWSAGASNIFGYDTNDVMGESFDIIFTEEDLKNGVPKNEIAMALKEGRATDNRWHIAKDKSLFYAYGLVFPLTGIDGELLGFVKILRDLTERKQSEDAIKKYVQELEDLNSHKESVMAILSHDLRSPLSAIIGTAKYLKDNFQKMKPENIQEMLEMLYNSSLDELDMLDYLVEWARIKYAADAFTPGQIKLKEYIETVFNTLNETADLKTINLKHDIDENTLVFADSKMLISIIQNIVSNAIHHTEIGGSIHISAKHDGKRLIVQIKDDGLGMSKEIQEKLFKPQMKTLSESRKKHKGAGIGLLLVKGFLEKNGGEIWVESVEGKGSSFYFTLPIDNTALKANNPDAIMFDESD